MNFKYYFFDLDNCLIHCPNPLDFFDNLLVKTFQNLSVSVPKYSKRHFLWKNLNFHQFLLKSWGISDIKSFWKYFNDFSLIYRKELIERGEIYIYEDVKPTLGALLNNNKKTAIITNSPTFIADLIVKEFRLKEFFNEIFSIDYNTNPYIAKPSPQGILEILKKFNYRENLSSAIMIGDSINDVLAGKAAKIITCLIIRDSKKTRFHFYRLKKKADFTIKNLDKLLIL